MSADFIANEASYQIKIKCNIASTSISPCIPEQDLCFSCSFIYVVNKNWTAVRKGNGSLQKQWVFLANFISHQWLTNWFLIWFCETLPFTVLKYAALSNTCSMCFCLWLFIFISANVDTKQLSQQHFLDTGTAFRQRLSRLQGSQEMLLPRSIPTVSHLSPQSSSS